MIGLVLALRPNVGNGISDDRISQGMIGLLVNAGPSEVPR